MGISSGETLEKVFGIKFFKEFEISIQMLILLLTIMRFYHPILQNAI